jgi:hypothetical protein
LHQNFENLTTRFVLMGNGELYALTITDYSKAVSFVQKYPFNYNENEFPETLLLKMLDLQNALTSQGFSLLEAQCFSFANILNSNDSGLALLKYENNIFKRQSIDSYFNESTNQTTYIKNNCN